MSRPAQISPRTSVLIHGDQIEITQKDPFDEDSVQVVTFSKSSAEKLLPIIQRFIDAAPARHERGPPVREPAGPVKGGNAQKTKTGSVSNERRNVSSSRGNNQ